MVWGRMRKLAIFVILFGLVLSACNRSSAPSASDEAQIKRVLAAESRGVVEKNIDELMSLWSMDAVVRDANHTPDDPSDDVVWEGKDAIRERYVKVVFPGNPSLVEHPTISIEIKEAQSPYKWLSGVEDLSRAEALTRVAVEHNLST